VILALETAVEVGGVALLEGPELIAEQVIGPGQRQAAAVLVAVDQLLRETGRRLDQIELIALSVGPGSFTGLRIGLATALGLAFDSTLRIAPVSTLAALSLHGGQAEPLAVLLDARRGQVYAGLYAPGGRALRPDAVDDVERWLGNLPAAATPLHLLGSGAQRYRERIAAVLGGRARFLPPELGVPRAASVGALGQRIAAAGGALAPAEVELRYLRASDARPQARPRSFGPERGLAGQPRDKRIP
jgi:tRNA threonylcarbamoyladenosine biosynthesis protein TsaB